MVRLQKRRRRALLEHISRGRLRRKVLGKVLCQPAEQVVVTPRAGEIQVRVRGAQAMGEIVKSRARPRNERMSIHGIQMEHEGSCEESRFSVLCVVDMGIRLEIVTSDRVARLAMLTWETRARGAV